MDLGHANVFCVGILIALVFLIVEFFGAAADGCLLLT